MQISIELLTDIRTVTDFVFWETHYASSAIVMHDAIGSETRIWILLTGTKLYIFSLGMWLIRDAVLEKSLTESARLSSLH